MIPKIKEIDRKANVIELECGCTFVWRPERRGSVDNDWIQLIGPGMYCSAHPCSEHTVRELLKQRGSR